MKSLPKFLRWLVPAILVLLVAAGVLWRLLLYPPTPPKPVPIPIAAAAPAPREVILYFGAADGTHLVAESRELTGCVDDQACQRSTLQALIDGPTGPGQPLLPPHTQLRDIHQDDQGLASVDFSAEFVQGQPGGSMSELLSVYSVVDTLAVNFSYLRQVRFLAEGEPLKTLKGHVDLRQPLAPDFSLTRSAAEEDAVPEVPKSAQEDK